MLSTHRNLDYIIIYRTPIIRTVINKLTHLYILSLYIHVSSVYKLSVLQHCVKTTLQLYYSVNYEQINLLCHHTTTYLLYHLLTIPLRHLNKLHAHL